MKYRICDDNTCITVALPQKLLDNLHKLSDIRLRLAMLLCTNKELSVSEIAAALGERYKLSTIEKELHYLEGAGIVIPVETAVGKRKSKDIADLPPKVQEKKMDSGDALRLAANSDEMRSLVRLTQDILGRTLSSGDISILASLMFVDEISVEMLALGIAHCAVEKKKPNLRYIERVMKGWLEDGVTDLASAEKHLERLERNENLKKIAAEAVGAKSVSYAESLMVFRWFDEYSFDEKMLKEAVMFAGEKRNIRYVNGILKRWFESGFKTVKDVRAANTGSNINTVQSVAKADDVMIKNRGTVPKFRAKGGK